MSLLTNIYLAAKTTRKPFSYIDSHLPSKHSDMDSWHLAADQYKNILPLRYISQVFSHHHPHSANIHYYRNSLSRKVFRIDLPDTTFIAKSFSFHNSFSKKLFRHRLYGYDEASNLVIAKKRGLPVPILIAYSERMHGLLCSQNSLVTEFLSDHSHPMALFNSTTNSTFSTEKILERSGNLLIKLYHAGCNHIDTHPDAFLLHKNNAEHDKIIDFQFAVFHKQPSVNILSFHLSHFGRSITKFVNKTIIDEWAHQTLKMVIGNDTDASFKLYKSYFNKEIPRNFIRMRLT